MLNVWHNLITMRAKQQQAKTVNIAVIRWSINKYMILNIFEGIGECIWYACRKNLRNGKIDEKIDLIDSKILPDVKMPYPLNAMGRGGN
jgi:hypothetical protein